MEKDYYDKQKYDIYYSEKRLWLCCFINILLHEHLTILCDRVHLYVLFSCKILYLLGISSLYSVCSFWFHILLIFFFLTAFCVFLWLFFCTLAIFEN